jgi:tol-pal system protein YbgF
MNLEAMTIRVACRRLAGALLIAAAAWLPAAAQDNGDQVRALQERLRRLDRDLVAVQKQAYRNADSGPPAAAAVPVAAAPDAEQAAATTLDTRIAALESELRATTGQIEETNFAVGEIRERLDRLVNDLDFRLAALEKAFADHPPNPAVAPAAARAGTAPGAAAAAPAAATPAVVKLPKGTPKEQYAYAFDFLKRSEYPQAEQALKEFVAAHPGDALAASAQYWLAETFFARNDFTGAAQQFLTSYQKYPQGPKAPDSLVKLGLSLAKLGKTPEACAAFTRFQNEYPTATGALRGRVADERQRLKCS